MSLGACPFCDVFSSSFLTSARFSRGLFYIAVPMIPLLCPFMSPLISQCFSSLYQAGLFLIHRFHTYTFSHIYSFLTRFFSLSVSPMDAIYQPIFVFLLCMYVMFFSQMGQGKTGQRGLGIESFLLFFVSLRSKKAGAVAGKWVSTKNKGEISLILSFILIFQPLIIISLPVMLFRESVSRFSRFRQ
jgi:hypothetical protein